MNLSVSPAAIKKALVRFLHRFHLTLFVVIVLGGVIVVVALLNSVVVRSGETAGYAPKTTSDTFDQATIDKIDALKTRDQNGGQLNLSGRTNPFVE